MRDIERGLPGNDDPDLSLYEIKSIIKRYYNKIDIEEDGNSTIFILRLKKIVTI